MFPLTSRVAKSILSTDSRLRSGSGGRLNDGRCSEEFEKTEIFLSGFPFRVDVHSSLVLGFFLLHRTYRLCSQQTLNQPVFTFWLCVSVCEACEWEQSHFSGQQNTSEIK